MATPLKDCHDSKSQTCNLYYEMATKPLKPIPFRMPPDVEQVARAAAESEGLTFSAWIRLAIDRLLAESERQPADA